MLFFSIKSHSLSISKNVNMIQKVVALLIPGITPEILSLPPFPTSATANPNLPLSIPLLPPTLDRATAANIPFIASTFSHACPTRAPGDQTRMHSVLSSFFTGPISGEEKKKRLVQKLQCMSYSFLLSFLRKSLFQQRMSIRMIQPVTF